MKRGSFVKLKKHSFAPNLSHDKIYIVDKIEKMSSDFYIRLIGVDGYALPSYKLEEMEMEYATFKSKQEKDYTLPFLISVYLLIAIASYYWVKFV